MLTNAIKFTRKGIIQIKGKVQREYIYSDKYVLQITVEDKGIGMSADEAASVFGGFYKTKNQESKSMNPYGNGIGLSFCKQICQSLEGDITVVSALGHGSAFTFTMIVKRV